MGHPKRDLIFLPSSDQGAVLVSGRVTLHEPQHTAGGRHPTPPEMYKTLEILGYVPYQLVQDSSINSMTHILTIETLRKLPIGSMGLLYLYT